MKTQIVLIAIMFLLGPISRIQSAEPMDFESWVQECVFKTAGAPTFVDADARAVAGGITFQKSRKLAWSPSVEGADGVMILHPVSANEPSTIRYRFPTLEANNKTFTLKMRGSDVEPGVLVKIGPKNKAIKEVQLGREWETIEVPFGEFPSGTQEILIEIHAVGWNCEYAYIDSIGFK
jgi:hypothetical protein